MLSRTPEIRVYPREDTLRRILQPRDTQVFSGSEVARHKGEGIEFADMRPWAPGDPLKRVNWRATARRGEVWVNESHPERNTDVILFVDSFAEARGEDASTLDLAVRATAALADAYIGRRDRVGLISFGGILRWLEPGMGTVQLYRIVDALLDTQIILSYYWTGIDVIPQRTLPPNSLVIALSPLLDGRSVDALLDLRARGHDLCVLDVSPVPFTQRPESGIDEVAYDIWILRRDALRHRLQRSGIAVAEWHEGCSAAGSGGGGESISALRTSRARLITGGLAVVTLAGVTAYAFSGGDAVASAGGALAAAGTVASPPRSCSASRSPSRGPCCSRAPATSSRGLTTPSSTDGLRSSAVRFCSPPSSPHGRSRPTGVSTRSAPSSSGSH